MSINKEETMNNSESNEFVKSKEKKRRHVNENRMEVSIEVIFKKYNFIIYCNIQLFLFSIVFLSYLSFFRSK